MKPEIERTIKTAPSGLKKVLKDFSRYPSLRNECYAFGYVRALLDERLIGDQALWMAIVGSVGRESEFRDEVQALLATCIEKE